MDIIESIKNSCGVLCRIKKAISLLTLTALIGTGTSLAALAPAQAQEAVASEWVHVELNAAPINNEGTMYLPLETSFQAVGMHVVWNPDGQTDRIKLENADASYQLYTTTNAAGVRVVAMTPEGPWSELVQANGQWYMSMAFFQSLTNRTVSVTGNALGLIDYAPVYDAAGVNTNAFWRAELAAYTYDAPVNTKGVIVDTASQFLGVPYVWGGSSPSGFDCSGLTSYVYAQNGIQLPRTAAAQQAAAAPISAADAQPGDLVFWGAPAYHVGIYLGDGQYIHAPAPGQSVCVGSSTWYPYHSIGRVA